MRGGTWGVGWGGRQEVAVGMGVGGVGRERERLDCANKYFCRRMFLQVCRSILCCSNTQPFLTVLELALSREQKHMQPCHIC